MQFIQGINFHSSKGFKYLISEGYQSFDFATDRHIAELLRIQSYSIAAGQKFYFVYPVKTPQGNKQVFGSGEIVRSLQPDRPVVVPFLQYFACNLSDSVKYTMNFESFFREYGKNYPDMYAKSQTEQNLTPELLTIPSAPIDNAVSDYIDLHECVGLRGSKTKRYVDTVEEGLALLNHLMASPNVIRWSYSAILTPLDAEYPENIVIVYGKPPRMQLNQKVPKDVLPFFSETNQQLLLQKFINFLATEKDMDLKTAKVELLDTQNIDELDELLKKFIKNYPEMQKLSDSVIASHSQLKITVQQLSTRNDATVQELIEIDRKLNNNAATLAKSWYDTSLADKCVFSDEDLYSSLAPFSAERLQKLLSSVEVKITNARLRSAIDKKIQDAKNSVINFWANEFAKLYPALVSSGTVKVYQPSTLTAEQCLARSGVDLFVLAGVKKTTELFGTQSFDKIVQYTKVFTDKIVFVVQKPNIDETTRSALVAKGASAIQEILFKIQERVERLEDITSPSCFLSEKALVQAVVNYVAVLQQNSKKQPNVSTDCYKVQNSLKTLIDIISKKQKKWLLDKQEKERKTLEEEQKQINEKTNELRDKIKGSSESGTFKFNMWTK